eukprot:2756615-Prymnesium_polylepis.1
MSRVTDSESAPCPWRLAPAIRAGAPGAAYSPWQVLSEPTPSASRPAKGPVARIHPSPHLPPQRPQRCGHLSFRGDEPFSKHRTQILYHQLYLFVYEDKLRASPSAAPAAPREPPPA